MDFHLIRWETISRLFELSSQDRLDALHDLLTVNELHEDIRKELQVLLSNHLITDYLDTKFPEPVKEKRKRTPRVKKPVADAPLEQNAQDKPVL